MIYMVAKNGKKLIILEPANIQNLKQGGTVQTPDDEHDTLIAYSPDILWTSAQIRQYFEVEGGTGEMDLDVLQEILDEGMQRSEVLTRPYHHKEMVSGRVESDKGRTKPN